MAMICGTIGNFDTIDLTRSVGVTALSRIGGESESGDDSAELLIGESEGT